MLSDCYKISITIVVPIKRPPEFLPRIIKRPPLNMTPFLNNTRVIGILFRPLNYPNSLAKKRWVSVLISGLFNQGPCQSLVAARWFPEASSAQQVAGAKGTTVPRKTREPGCLNCPAWPGALLPTLTGNRWFTFKLKIRVCFQLNFTLIHPLMSVNLVFWFLHPVFEFWKSLLTF